jgi:tRNA (guanine-N7-)-methyltransferase
VSEADAASPFRVYGRRKGKPLKPARQAALDTVLPLIRIERPAPGAIIDLASLFGDKRRALWIEIGFGAGEHLAATASAHPDVGFIGCEIFINGIASLARHIDAGGIANVRVFPDDARILLAALPDAAVERMYLLFPDPWPKARHAKRRFIGPANLDAIARVLADGGELRVASDDAGYIRWTLEHLTNHPAFSWTARGPEDWRAPPPDSVATRYAEKARAAGRSAVFLTFLRRRRDLKGRRLSPVRAAGSP